ncbi:MAG: zinc-ribbon and DUF3426 domain-containing protein [Methylococcaceae bacterium]
MHTRCPDCQTRYPITAAQLRAGRGEARCEHCDRVFDALAGLEQTAGGSVPPVLSVRSNQPVKIPELTRHSEVGSADKADSLFSLTADTRPGVRKNRPRPAAPKPHVIPWNTLTLALLLLLWIQYLFFEGGRLVQNAQLRPTLEQLCAALGCVLPAYKDVRLIRAGHASLQKSPQSDEAYEFKLVISNQASLPQAFPRLHLLLGEIDGLTTATRIFEPSEYLARRDRETLMMSGKTYEIRLLLQAPGRSIGSYQFTII